MKIKNKLNQTLRAYNENILLVRDTCDPEFIMWKNIGMQTY